MNAMQEDDSHDANSNRAPGCDQGGAAGRFQPSAKLIEKMEQLAKWRIDPSLIEFPEDAGELQGGHATVSRAFLNPSNTSGKTDEPDGRSPAGQKVVAVKKLKIPADKNLERLLGLAFREAGFLVKLSHRNIVGLEGFVEDVSEGIIWLVFPWEANGNLRDFIASQDWEIPERIWLINDVARGVEYLHSQNPPICHGDLKSVNILVNSNCCALITDFGSARRVREGDPDVQREQVESEQQPAARLEATFCASTNTITLTGNEFTLRWAAPELLNDEPPTVKVDIWALGWIAYEVMTNAIPFQDVVKDSIVIKRVTQGHLPSITGDPRMSLMLKLCCLMSECWSSDPSQRPTSVDCVKSLGWMPMIAPNPGRAIVAMIPTVRSPQLLLGLGEMHRQQGDYANASKFYTEALGLFTDNGDKEGRARALERLGELHRLQGRVEEAVTVYSDALEILTDIDNKQVKTRVLRGLAYVYQTQNKYSEAASFYSDALKISTDINDSSGKAPALFGLAEVHRLRKEYNQAVPFYSDALRIYTDIGERHGRASAMWGLAEVHRLQNEYNQAIAFYSDALQIYTDIGSSRGRAFALLGLAQANRSQGRHNDAIDLYEQAAQLFEQVGHPKMVNVTLKQAADVRRLVEVGAAA
ncbi:hypothetical protein M407DRAFT_17978 [Tulasnella calospora MUT 4182]|uniref:Protein kinase domain-containing protein n=1 Tax=Tulasnella calospora MUT 4182 TaxID=1051891 RepID=A0A0C3LGL2_9AGAM|nr:hypothetical protein M407DRAFT_17978 [Tulasnella calospora MUT 4182]